MSRKKTNTGSKSGADAVIDRAIKAAHDEFECAITADWDTSADSAKIRNAMTPLPHRCRHCGKSVAGLGKLCECKTKIEYERFFSNPREVLLGMVQQRCSGIATTPCIAKFAKIVGRIAVANDRDLKWVESKVQELLTSLKRAGRKWIIGICPLPFKHTGVLPAWVRDRRTEIPDGDVHRGMSPEDTETHLVQIDSEIERHFETAKKAALDYASLQKAQVVRLATKSTPRGRARQDLKAAFVAKFKRDNPEASVEQICRNLDSKRCPVRDGDERAGFSTWHDAWKNKDHRPRIKRFISGIRPAAPEKKVESR